MGLEWFLKGDFNKAIEVAEQGIALNPRSISCHRHKIGGLVELGRMNDAAKCVQLAMELVPGFRVREFLSYFRDRTGVAETVWQPYGAALLKARFPE